MSKSTYEKMFDPGYPLKQESRENLVSMALGRIVLVVTVWLLLFTLDKLSHFNGLNLLATIVISIILVGYIILEILATAQKLQRLELDLNLTDLEQ